VQNSSVVLPISSGLISRSSGTRPSYQTGSSKRALRIGAGPPESSIFAVFCLSIFGANEPHFSETKALNIGDRRIVYWQKSIICFLPPTPRLLPPSLLRHRTFLDTTSDLLGSSAQVTRCSSWLASSGRLAVLVAGNEDEGPIDPSGQANLLRQNQHGTSQHSYHDNLITLVGRSRFRMLREKCKTPIFYRLFCEEGNEV